LKWPISDVGFDAYDRRARLQPGLIALLPALVVPLALFPNEVLGNVGRSLVALTSYVGLFYLLANLARGKGKALEPHLLSKWGGWPTTVLLSFRDRTIDQHTKARYHKALCKIAPNIALPSVEEEQREPDRADDVYRSLTRKLIESRRGPKYPLVHLENAQYGFRRNMLGLKPTAISLVILSGLVIALIWWLPFRHSQLSPDAILDDLTARWRIYGLFLGNLIILIFWTFNVDEPWVRQSAYSYAEALLRTLEPTSKTAARKAS
jgi:hypothetical protein